MAHSNARQSIPEDTETQGARPGPVLRFSRTDEQRESNRAFMAAAGRVEFGRYEATLSAVWIAFAYFASLGVERICYATVDHIAERAKVSGRTVRRHIPALIERDLIYSENREGGRKTAVWKISLVVSPRPGRADTVSDEIRDRTYVQGRAPSRGQARPCVKGVESGSRPVTTAAPLKGSPIPSPRRSITVLATPDEAQTHMQVMREIVQRTTGTTTTTEDDQPSHFNLDPDTEARLAEQDRLLHKLTSAEQFSPSRQPATPTTIGCAQCGHNRLMGGCCDQCGHDDGTGFQAISRPQQRPLG